MPRPCGEVLGHDEGEHAEDPACGAVEELACDQTVPERASENEALLLLLLLLLLLFASSLSTSIFSTAVPHRTY